MCLTGCASAPPPERAADGLDWDESWVTVGGKVGVDTPEGMDPMALYMAQDATRGAAVACAP